jgi:hypothetical protein
MKILWVVLATVFLGQLSLSSQSSSKPKSNTAPDPKNNQTFVWAETGLSFTLAPGWMMANDTDDNSQRTWRGPDNTRFFFLRRATHLQSRKTNYQYAGWLDANAQHVTFITGAWRNFMMTESILRCKPAEIDTGKHQCARAIFCAIVIQLLF